MPKCERIARGQPNRGEWREEEREDGRGQRLKKRLWEHLKNNWDQVERSFGIFQGIPNVVGSLEHLCDVASKNDVEQFFSSRPIAGTDRTLRQSLETIERCVATKSTQAKHLGDFLGAARPNP